MKNYTERRNLTKKLQECFLQLIDTKVTNDIKVILDNDVNGNDILML